MNARWRKVVAILCTVSTVLAAVPPVWAGAADDLKQIEYKYYFRGKYPQAIEALQTFLARENVPAETRQRASEFLAASYVLAGQPGKGKDAFSRIVVANPSYAGPDPAVFKPEVVNIYAQARAEYRPLTSQEPAVALADTTRDSASPAGVAQTASSKPIYKKWWFYAGAAAVIGGVAAAAGGGGGGADAPARGSVVVGVTVK